MRKLAVLLLIAATLSPAPVMAAASKSKLPGAGSSGIDADVDNLVRRIERDLDRLTRNLDFDLRRIERPRQPTPAAVTGSPQPTRR
jgi:hypothetical protein